MSHLHPQYMGQWLGQGGFLLYYSVYYKNQLMNGLRVAGSSACGHVVSQKLWPWLKLWVYWSDHPSQTSWGSHKEMTTPCVSDSSDDELFIPEHATVKYHLSKDGTPGLHLRTKRTRGWTPIMPSPVAFRTRTCTRNRSWLFSWYSSMPSLDSSSIGLYILTSSSMRPYKSY